MTKDAAAGVVTAGGLAVLLYLLVIRDAGVNAGAWIVLFGVFIVSIVVAYANWDESRYRSVAVGAAIHTVIAALLGIAAFARHWDGSQTVTFCVVNAVVSGIVSLSTSRLADRA